MDGQHGASGVSWDADATLRRTLTDLLNDGTELGTGQQASLDLANYQAGLANPLARIVTTPHRSFSTTAAIARFVWMAAGNDRLADIAFYVPPVKNYTDDGLTVPGSSYGQRLRRSSPGLDQLPGVVSRLRGQGDTRRAAAVIWTPQDAIRDSKDIPCAFGVFYRVLNGRLNATTVMRSNNAFRLLAFNMFEFTMLAELVAAELGVEMGEYTHWAASMHVLDEFGERSRAQALVDAPPAVSLVMPSMPRDGSALEAVRLLAVAEAELRHAPGPVAVLELRDKTARVLGPYWTALFDTLVVYVLRLQGAGGDADAVLAGVPAYLPDPIPPAEAAAGPETFGSGQLSLVDLQAPGGSARRLAEETAPGRDEIVAALERAAGRHEEHGGDSVTRPEFAALLDGLLAQPGSYGLAARSKPVGQAAQDRIVTAEDFTRRLLALRGR